MKSISPQRRRESKKSKERPIKTLAVRMVDIAIGILPHAKYRPSMDISVAHPPILALLVDAPPAYPPLYLS
jgi:hypothetical protein